MQEIVELISNYGIGIACVGYMIYFQNTTMKEMLKTLTSIQLELTSVKDTINQFHGSQDSE